MKLKTVHKIAIAVTAIALISAVSFSYVSTLRDKGRLVEFEVSAPTANASQATEGLININTADSETLCELNGIGPVIAKNIITFRQKNGDFTHISELLDVSGIGLKTYDKFSNKISV